MPWRGRLGEVEAEAGRGEEMAEGEGPAWEEEGEDQGAMGKMEIGGRIARGGGEDGIDGGGSTSSGRLGMVGEEDDHGKKREEKERRKKRKERRREKRKRCRGRDPKRKERIPSRGGWTDPRNGEKGERVAAKRQGWERKKPGETLGFGG